MKQSSASLLLEFQSTCTSDQLSGTQTSIATTNTAVPQQLLDSNRPLQHSDTSCPSIATNSEESGFSSSHPQKVSQPTAQSSFSSTIISDLPSNENAEQSVQQSHMISVPQGVVKSSNSRSALYSTPNSTTRLQPSTGFLSPKAQLTINAAHQPQSYVNAQPYDSSTVTGATSSVFHSAISTLFDDVDASDGKR